MELIHILESVLFANGKPLTVKELRAILKDAAEYEPSPQTESHKDRSLDEVKAALQELKALYDADTTRSFFLQEIGDTYQFASRPEYGAWIKQLFDQYRPQRLSQSALETLSIIAYRQPITRADIEAVRGVQVDAMVQTLMERGLIKIAGRAELPGRPMLYETTQAFLEHFGLKNLDELPNAEELRAIKLKTAQIPATAQTGADQRELALAEGQSEQPPAPETPESVDASAEQSKDKDSENLDTIPVEEENGTHPKTEA